MAGPSLIKFRHRYGHDPLRYPMKAVAYTLSHRSLWSIVFRIACIGVAMAVIILIVLLATALKPQAELISPNLEWWAWLIAVFAQVIKGKKLEDCGMWYCHFCFELQRYQNLPRYNQRPTRG